MVVCGELGVILAMCVDVDVCVDVFIVQVGEQETLNVRVIGKLRSRH